MPRRPERPPDRSKLARGRWGESLAARHYERLGFDVIDRNWRTRTGELDLVLRRDDLLVFCEVKTRRTDRYGPPALAVDRGKQRRIRALAAEWLREHPTRGLEVRFDVVAITDNRIRRYEFAF